MKLWDYSRRPGNVDGIICPLFSAIWTALCVLYLLFIHPQVRAALSWFADNLAFSFVIGAFFGVFAIDVCYSFRLVSIIKAAADEYRSLSDTRSSRSIFVPLRKPEKKNMLFFSLFSSKLSIREHIKAYAEKKRDIK